LQQAGVSKKNGARFCARHFKLMEYISDFTVKIMEGIMILFFVISFVFLVTKIFKNFIDEIFNPKQ